MNEKPFSAHAQISATAALSATPATVIKLGERQLSAGCWIKPDSQQPAQLRTFNAFF
jgi:hypothetical protein